MINNVEWVVPEGESFEKTYNNNVELANAGVTIPKNRDELMSVCEECMDRVAEAIVLGGTDLFIAFDDILFSLDMIDCAEVHIERLAELAAQERKIQRQVASLQELRSV